VTYENSNFRKAGDGFTKKTENRPQNSGNAKKIPQNL
jgi:hypothetical protein